MNNQIPVDYSATEVISQMLIGGIEELVGQEVLQDLLTREAIPFELDLHDAICLTRELTFGDIKKIEIYLVQVYGENGCRGAALRVGRTFFQIFFQKCGVDCGLNSLEYRMKPLKKRIFSGLETLSTFLSDATHFQIKTREDGDKWYWILENGEWNRDSAGGVPLEDFSIGLLQAYLSWASGGKAYSIRKNNETAHARVIEITKKAIGY